MTEYFRLYRNKLGIPKNRKEDRDMKVVDMHCDTIAEIYKDHKKGGS